MNSPESRNDTVVLGGLVLFGVLAILLGVVNLRRAIASPTAGQRAAANAPAPAITKEDFERQQRDALATLDTDGDGLSDGDELERTHSSPFIADSDSDGKTDKQEVDAGEDPNCPRGQTCVAAPRAEATPDMRLAPVLPDGTPATAPANPTTPNSALTPADIRRTLAQQGFPSKLLDALSDAQLLAAYQQTLRSVGTLPDGTASPVGGTLSNLFTRGLQTQATGSNTNDLASTLRAVPRDPTQIRNLLEANGIPKSQLATLDDAGILSLWDQMITALTKQQAAASMKP